MVVISEKETFKYLRFSEPCCGPGIPTELRAGRSRDRLPVGVRFSAPVQTGPGAHPTSCTMCTGSFPEVKSGRGVTLTPHPLLVPWSRKSSAITLLPYCCSSSSTSGSSSSSSSSSTSSSSSSSSK